VKVFDLLQFVFLLLSVFHGYGHPSASLSREDSTLAQKYLWISQPLYIWSLSCVKIGIACLLLLIPCYDKKKAKMWPIFLGCTIFFQIAISGVISGLQFSTCKPLRAIWDRTVENPKCRAIGETQTSIYINMAMIIFTDLMLAGLPLAFLSVKGRREKGEICIIVVLLLLTSGVTIYKITLVPNYSVEGT
jgi:cytochrome bd-type quinol oxidase subunit 2